MQGNSQLIGSRQGEASCSRRSWGSNQQLSGYQPTRSSRSPQPHATPAVVYQVALALFAKPLCLFIYCLQFANEVVCERCSATPKVRGLEPLLQPTHVVCALACCIYSSLHMLYVLQHVVYTLANTCMFSSQHMLYILQPTHVVHTLAYTCCMFSSQHMLYFLQPTHVVHSLAYTCCMFSSQHMYVLQPTHVVCSLAYTCCMFSSQHMLYVLQPTHVVCSPVNTANHVTTLFLIPHN